MALFNLFKKKETPAKEPDKKENPTKAAPAGKPEPPVEQPRQPAPPVSRPVSPPVAQPQQPPVQNREQRGPRPTQTIQWPRYGASVEALVAASQVKVFVDASFVQGPAFAAFSRAWSQHRKNQFATRYYFIPSYEKQKLSPEQQQAVSGEDCREFACRDSKDCFAQMVAKGLKWNILWLTESNTQGLAAQNAARETNVIYLRWYGIDAAGNLKSLPAPAGERQPSQSQAAPKVFPHAVELAKISRAIDPARTVPGRGDSVTAPGIGNRYVLREPVMTDHSSITYKTSDSAYFAKIYTPEALRLDLFENKAKRMIQQKVDIPGVCWPQDILKNANGSFVGILVPASTGVQLSKSIFGGTSGIEKYFPKWDKRDICAVALTILRTVCQLQKLGVVFGCFNPASVYIMSTDKVYFVDVDTWQLEGYPVLSRNMTFTPPELLGDPKKVRLFTSDQENYQTALLAFMLMMPGKYPYAKKNRKTDDDSLRNMSFPFSIGEDMRRSKDAERPTGAWQIVWDHLPYKLCYNFYHTFHQNGNFSKPGTRLHSSVWLEQIEQFGKYLATAEGAQSRMLFPATFRRDSKRIFVRCQICGKEHPDFYFLRSVRIQGEPVNVWDRGHRVCLPCAVDRSTAPTARFTCKHCGRTFYYTNKTQIMHQIGKLDYDWNEQKWCRDCKKHTVRCSKCGKDVPIYQLKEFKDAMRNQVRKVCGDCFHDMVNEDKRRREAEKARKNMTYTYITCRNCGRSFGITYGEKEFFDSKGFSLPTKCPRCRTR